MRELISSISRALDVFVLQAGRATSVVNGSYLAAENDEALLKRLEAELIWTRSNGYAREFNSYIQVYRADISFVMTELPEPYVDIEDAVKRALAREGLPASPIIGFTIEQAAAYVVSMCERVVYDERSLSAGLRRQSWVCRPESEADFQDLLFLALKPTFPDLNREAVEALVDGQRKISDFNMFEGKLVIDVKLVSDRADLAALQKDLPGLAKLYLNNPRCHIVIFPIYSRAGVIQDKPGLERRLGVNSDDKQVIAKVIEFTSNSN
jgi:hypothetical protein